MAFGKLRDWLMVSRTSVRLTFVLRLLAMAISAVTSLIWTRLLLQSMGNVLYGVFVSFQVIPRLGGLGDLGISGAVAVRTGQMIGRNEGDRLREFLASARTLFLVVATVLGLAFFALSPGLPKWLHFQGAPGAGSLTMLFQTGAIALFLMVAGGYVHGVNAGCNNIMWPIFPALILSQFALGAHWLLARWGSPLWGQHLPYLAATLFNVLVVWYLLKIAHPELSVLRPLKVELASWRELITTGGWVYLYGLGNLVFTMTDRLLVNAGFGSAAVPLYLFNYKACELALQVVSSASFASQAKINQWIANPAAESQARANQEVQRLCLFQSFLGTGCALAYLALNDLFISYWVGPAYNASAFLQWAFAFNLAIVAGGDAGIQMAGLCGSKGLRTAGLAIGLTGLLNLALSVVAMRAGSMVGIAFATVLAQTLLSLFLGWRTCRHLKIAYLPWTLRSWLLPVLTVMIGAALHGWIGSKTWTQAGGLAAIFLLLVMACAWAMGVGRQFLRTELAALRGCLPR